MGDLHETVYQRMRKVVADHFEYDGDKAKSVLDDGSVTFSSLGADSLDAVELAMEIEEEFGIEISDADAVRVFGKDYSNTVDEATSIVAEIAEVQQ